MIKSGRKFKDDNVGERLDLAKAYCRDSNMRAIKRGYVWACSLEKKKS